MIDQDRIELLIKELAATKNKLRNIIVIAKETNEKLDRIKTIIIIVLPLLVAAIVFLGLVMFEGLL